MRIHRRGSSNDASISSLLFGMNFCESTKSLDYSEDGDSVGSLPNERFSASKILPFPDIVEEDLSSTEGSDESYPLEAGQKTILEEDRPFVISILTYHDDRCASESLALQPTRKTFGDDMVASTLVEKTSEPAPTMEPTVAPLDSGFSTLVAASQKARNARRAFINSITQRSLKKSKKTSLNKA